MTPLVGGGEGARWGGGGVGRVEVGRKVRRHEKLPTSIPVIAT